MKNNIKVERARLNMSQDELAKRVGVARQTIHYIETCKIVPSALLAAKIAKVFNARFEDIFEFEFV